MRLDTKIIAILLLLIVLDTLLGGAFYFFRAQIKIDHELKIHSTVILVLIVGVNIGLIYYLTKEIIIGPIQKLIEATNRMASNGSVDFIDITTNDEFDQLARSLESSSVAIHAYYQKIQSSQQALHYSEERFHDVTDAAGEYIWEITPEGLFRFLTSRAEDTYGRKIDFLLGKSIYEFIQAEGRDNLKKILRESSQGKRSFKDIEVPTVHRNGLVIWQKISGLPVLNEQGDVALFRGVGLEITDYKMVSKRLEEKEWSLNQLSCQLSESDAECRSLKKQVVQLGDDLKTAEESLESTKLSKANFLKNVNHEISTPLTNINAMFELMKSTSLNSEQKKYVAIASESIATLLNVMNDAIDHTKLEAKLLKLQIEDFKLDELIQKIVTAKRPKAQEKKLKLTVKIADDSLVSLSGDPIRIKQVLDNLLSNAIKFTAQGAIDLIVTTQQRDDSSVLLKCIVRDTGVGIDPKLAQNLFDHFSYQNGIGNETMGSTGLGLSISKELCELMGGQIGYNPEYENGSEFWFEVVCEQSKKASQGKEKKSKEIRLPAEEPAYVATEDSTEDYGQRL
jgi:PAS domain S-box-containing protein